MNAAVFNRLARGLLGLLTGLGLASSVFGDAPENDDFANATVISGIWGTVSGNTEEATAETDEPEHAGAAAANSVWYKLIPIQDGTLTIHTFGSAIDTRLAVYSIPPNTNIAVNSSLFPVAASDDFDLRQDPFERPLRGPNGPYAEAGPSAVRFPAKLGTAYYVVVDSNGGGGEIQLTWGYDFGGLFYFTKPQVEAGKTEGGIQFAVGRTFGCSGRVLVDVVTTNYTGQNMPATEGVDYIPGQQTLIFDDYETLRTFRVPIIDAEFAGDPGDPEDPEAPVSAPFNPNYHFNVQIVSVRFHDLENTNILAPPAILTGQDTSVGRMLDVNIPRGAGDPGPDVEAFTNNIINFEVRRQVTTEYAGDGDGYVHVWLTRSGTADPNTTCSIKWGINSAYSLGDLRNNLFDLSPESDYATPDPPSTPAPGVGPADFGPPSSGTVSWGSYDFLPKEILIPINDDSLVEFNEDFLIELTNIDAQNCRMGEINKCTVTILFDYHDQPAGALEAGFNAHTEPPNNPVPGTDAAIFAMAVQPDQRILIGGAFTTYNAFLRNRIARVNPNGTLDRTFDPGNGADGLVTTLALQPDGYILIGGDFLAVNGFNRYHVARLTPSGAVDTTFNPGAGADGTVWSLAISTNDSVIIGGEFNSFNNYPSSRVARLDSSGNLDLAFDTSSLGINGTVWAVAPLTDGKVIIGGDFNLVGGLLRPGIARLNADGSVDADFDPGLGANDTVYTLWVQNDGNILVGGAFTQFHTASHHGLTRLLPDGQLDPAFNPGAGANDVVYSILVSPTNSAIYAGGMFTTFNQTRRVGLVRLFPDGTVDTSFLDTAYNQFAGLTGPWFNPDRYPRSFVYALGLEDVEVYGIARQDVLIAGSFNRVGGGGTNRRSYDTRENLALLVGGETVGPGNLTLTHPTYSVNENGSFLWVTLTRTNGTLGSVGTRFSPDPFPVGAGAAVYGKDYTYNPLSYGLSVYGSTWGPPGGPDTRMLSDGIWWRNYPDPRSVLPEIQQPGPFNNARVDIHDNAIKDGNRTFGLNLTIPWQLDTFFLGGANMPLATALGPQPSTTSLLLDNENPPGTFSFITTNYTVSETAGRVSILVVRTNGTGGTVTLKYLTQNLVGSPPPGVGFARASTNSPTPNGNYYATNGTLTFYPGITSRTFEVNIRQDGQINPDLALLLVITNIAAQNPASGTALGGITNAWLTIIDGDFPQGRLNFSSVAFMTNETAGNAVITVTRTGGSQGTMTVLCSTTNTLASATNTPAVPNVNYLPVTNVLLTWANGDSAPKSFTVPVLHDNQITSNLTVGLTLSTPVLNGMTNYTALGPVSNAVLSILNVDSLGSLSFSSPHYSQNENGGFAIIPVVRQGGSVGTVIATFNASTGINATPGIDFLPTNGTLAFGPGELSKVFTVQLLDNAIVDAPDRAVLLQLTNPVPPGILSSPATASLSLIDDETFNLPPGGMDPNFHPLFNGAVHAVALQPNGAIVAAGSFTLANYITRHRVARLNADGTLDFTFASKPGGADNTVRALALQTDGRMLIGGDFLSYDGINRSRFARLNLDGTLDWQFDPGSALNDSAYAIAETFTDDSRSERKILVGGNFTLANGAPRRYLAQFNDNGSVDLAFKVAAGAGGLDGPVWAIAVQPDRKIIIGGDFRSVNGEPRNHIARLNPDGSLDASFSNSGIGANSSVRALAVQRDGRILVGGLFTSVEDAPQNRIARLNSDGSLDASFNTGAGANDAVYAIALQPDNRILLGGAFTRCGGVARSRVTRLNSDGSVDPTINFGAGCNNFVAAIAVQPDDAIVLGGGFTTYDNASAACLARIYGRSISGSGTFEFTSAIYGVDETAPNATITVRRRGGTSAPINGTNVYVTVAATDGPPPNGAVNDINYKSGLFTNTFPPGETFATFLVPILRDFQVTPDLAVSLQLTSIDPLGLAGLGNQPIATLWVSNVDNAVRFSSPSYTVAKNVQEGRATITIERFGSAVGAAQVDFMTTMDGTAQPYGRYLPVATNVVFAPGQQVQNVFIPIINDTQVLSNQTVTMVLTSPTNSLLSTPSAATLTILETSTSPGTLAFSSASYGAGEGDAFAYLDVLRTGGSAGSVTVDYYTRDGTALAGVKYVATNSALVFADGETRKTIAVPIINNASVELNQTFFVVLTNATGGAVLSGPTTVPVTIVDDDVGISFGAPIHAVSETAGTVSLSVLRQNGTNLTTTVHYATTNLTALAGTNYVGVSNGTLTFNPGETAKSLAVRILRDPRVTGDLQFMVNLRDPSAPAQLFNYSSTVVNVLDVDTGFTFGTTNRLVVTNADFSTVTTASYGVLKSGSNLLVTVVRSNANTGTVSVNYATATNANDTAIAGVDYGATSGLLTFSNNVSARSFTVPIFNHRQPEGDRTFSINLFNPSPGAQLIPPAAATVTITDDLAALSFSSSDYRVNENGGSATITVLRSNYTNSIVSVDYATTPLSAIPNVNYTNVSGTLTFNRGETVKTFRVPVMNDGILHGDTTVQLGLSNPVGNAVFINPNAATLTILETDGSLIVNAGASLIRESGPTNGVIDPGETVTLLFALRNQLGTNTASLVATLLATNGVSNPRANFSNSPAVHNYGVLVPRGPSTFRPYSFTAAGTNGQPISATFQLQDGTTDLGQVVFNFVLGQSPIRFGNSAAIVINDYSSATPYPSTINVSGLAGLLTRATVTLSNLSHSWPSDIDALLVSPTGQKSFLMAKCGGSYPVSNVTLTFDDAAANSLTNGKSGPMISGTNRPTSYALATPPFPPALTPPPPYHTNLSVFNGKDPNGTWSLYVIDDGLGGEGVISNGWSLSLITAGVVPAAADVGLAMAASPLTNIVNNNFTLTLALTNYGPARATNIVVTNLLPAGIQFVSGSQSAGSLTNHVGLVAWSVPWLETNTWAVSVLTVRATNTGVFTNTAKVTTSTSDLNPDDDIASAIVAVVAPTANLVLSLADSPSPVRLTNYLTYTMSVSNAGPATATGVVVSNTLPAGVSFISASPSGARYTTALTASGRLVVTFTNLGNLPPGARTNLSVTVRTEAAGTITDTAGCRSEIVDPFKANNAAAVKTIVQAVPLPLAFAPRSGALAISWPAYAGYRLESTADLRPPVIWEPVTDAHISLAGSTITAIVPIGPGNRFFRLNWSAAPAPLPLGISHTGANVTIAWPADLWNYNLESADTLSPPLVWTRVTSPAPVLVNGLNTVTLPIGSSSQVFRLRAQQP